MARIRSVHPSLFTDEAWVSCSPLARIFYIGLMTDADDQGLFEWKPLQLKMRLLPGDACIIPELLAELVAVNLIAELESAGKRLGAIRYFRRFQRPKSPTSAFILPAHWRRYVGLDVSISEIDTHERDELPPNPENFIQMEDGGDNKEEGEEDSSSSLMTVKPDFEDFWLAYPRKVGKGAARRSYVRALSKIKVHDGHTVLMLALAMIRPRWTDPKYIPHAATWLNQERWQDEVSEETHGQPTSVKLAAKQANMAASFRGAEAAIARRREP